MGPVSSTVPSGAASLRRANRELQPQDGFVAFDRDSGAITTGVAPGVAASDTLQEKLRAPIDSMSRGLNPQSSPVHFQLGTTEMNPVGQAGATGLNPENLRQVVAAVDPQHGGLLSLLATNSDHGSTRTRVLALPSDYSGPILVSTVKNTLYQNRGLLGRFKGPGQPVEGAQNLLQSVANLDVPLVYVDADPNQPATRDFLSQMPAGILLGGPGETPTDVVRQLQTTYPHARLYALGNDKGDDAQAFAGLGDRAFIHCDDASQRKVPAGFKGVIADDYTAELQDKVLQEMGVQPQGVQNLDALQPVPVMPKPNMLGRIEDLLPLAHGVPGKLASDVSVELHRQQGAVDETRCLSDASLCELSNDKLAALGSQLLRRDLIKSPEAGPEFMRLVTAHGTDAGNVDTILQRIPNFQDRIKGLDPKTRAAFAAMEQAHQAVPGDWAGFDRYVDAATGTRRQPGTVEPLINGQVAFPRILSDIDHAQKSINMTMFAFQSDEAGWEFAKHLAAASDPAYAQQLARTDPTFADRARLNRHVDVRVLYDDFGSARSNGLPTDPNIYQFFRDHGVQVLCHPSGPLADHCDHRKIIVLDGETGYIGGMNVGNEYRDLWHDVMSRVQGPPVNDMQRLFDQQWQQNGGTLTPSQEAALTPSLPGPPNAAPVSRVSALPPGRTGLRPVRIMGHVGHDDRNIKMTYLRAIDTATKRICIADPYLSDPDIMAHLEAAARRGVDVTVVLPKTNNHKLEGAATRHDYAQLQAAGVHVYEYYGRVMAHEKVAIFDDHLATIGSSNLDKRSDFDDEANVWVEDPSVVQNLYHNLFQADLQQSDNMADYHPTVPQKAYNEVGNLLRNQM